MADNKWIAELERLRAKNKELLEAINSEPELPGNMPDEMWEAIRNDRDAMTETMRIIVRQTKANIKFAIAKAGEKRVVTRQDMVNEAHYAK